MPYGGCDVRQHSFHYHLHPSVSLCAPLYPVLPPCVPLSAHMRNMPLCAPVYPCVRLKGLLRVLYALCPVYCVLIID